MGLKELTQEEIDTMGYDEVAYLVLEEKGKKMKLLDLFKEVCKAKNLPDDLVEERIADFFELLSINKKFVMLTNGYWDLAIKHKPVIIIEDDNEIIDEEEIEEGIDDLEEDEDNLFYEDDMVNEDEEDDDLKDLVIIDEDENIQE